jgi:hypothetical protein
MCILYYYSSLTIRRVVGKTRLLGNSGRLGDVAGLVIEYVSKLTKYYANFNNAFV